MKIAQTAKLVIQGVYFLSPYAWLDRYLKKREAQYAVGSEEQKALRNRRLVLSERYIGYWFFTAVLLYLLSTLLPAWLAILFIIRAIGILNKEMGVVLFGICKITEGTAVSATGRVIVLALVNYLTALFLFAATYSVVGGLDDVPAFALDSERLTGLLHAAQIHFSLASSYTPATALVAILSIFHSAYCFLFGTLVISLFVSLLSVKPLQS
ncbi:hypothetical protein [Woeseia oceani]|uniref:Uncharacterized protein n=1 Tax=Woeseia oceani TaxID=1548547 RepID=A0A193LLH5_9GAMM|nr:hypothetical protein [Woeseia oceani]ANO53342.1 hypothetical protein BA177_16625 [Woeseia oceani]